MSALNWTKTSLSIAITLGASLCLAAKHDFNSLIDENMVVQKQLAKKLQNQLGTDKIKKNETPDFKSVGKEVVGNSTENYVAETKDRRLSRNTSRKSSKDLALEKKNFKRLSQEFKGLR